MKKLDWLKGSFILWAGLSLLGCATTQDVRTLDDENRRLYTQLDNSQKEMESLKKEFAAFKREAESDRVTVRREDSSSKADLALRLQNLESEVGMLTAGVEEYKDFAKKPSKEIERMREDVAFRLRILEEKNKAQEERGKTTDQQLKAIEDRLRSLDSKLDQIASKAMESEKALAAKESPSPPSETKGPLTVAGSLYKDAYETFQKGDMEGARGRFEAFLRQYPNAELSGNAQFWIGETYYQKKDYERAILEYEKVMAKYPEGNKVPAALFKQALAFAELGDKTNARNLLKRVIEKYPNSDQAELAKKRLETLK